MLRCRKVMYVKSTEKYTERSQNTEADGEISCTLDLLKEKQNTFEKHSTGTAGALW